MIWATALKINFPNTYLIIRRGWRSIRTRWGTQASVNFVPNAPESAFTLSRTAMTPSRWYYKISLRRIPWPRLRRQILTRCTSSVKITDVTKSFATNVKKNGWEISRQSPSCLFSKCPLRGSSRECMTTWTTFSLRSRRILMLTYLTCWTENTTLRPPWQVYSSAKNWKREYKV